MIAAAGNAPTAAGYGGRNDDGRELESLRDRAEAMDAW
jgi:hypothetical protein